MTETDLQLGGGYTYQWECAILLALNYFFEPVRYNPTLFDLVNDFLGQVAEIHLEGEDRESGVDLEDINLVNGDRRILIQVKTKQAEGERWTPTDTLLLKALYRFYDSSFLTEQPEDTRFVFLTNRPFNRTLVRVKSAIKKGTVERCAQADKLCQHLDRYARKEREGKSIDIDRFREMLARTALVEYLAVDEVKANVKAKLQAHGRRDWEQAHALLFEHFARQSTRIGGGTVTRESVIEMLGPPPAPVTPSPRPIPFQFPRRAVHFQGREQELAALLDYLRPGAAVTLCGPGGIGKTALAAEALARLPEDRFPDGIIFHTFYRQPEAALALEHIARSYGHDPRPTPADAARMALAGRRALLVLDGAEEADDLEAVLACAGDCGVLITSRRRGDAPDPARRFDLSPLEEAQAVALLQAWGGGWAEDDEAAYAICQLVGGLPLAVQLVGAYLASHEEEAADYLAWLETTPLAALDLGQRQHESVPVLMEHSLKRVSKRARTALGLVGLMGLAPFGRGAITAGLRIRKRKAGQVLGELVDYSLLVRQDGCYAVSHALIHTYARERLSPGEEAMKRLTAYYLALARETDDHAVLNAEWPHLLTALADAHQREDWKTTLDFAWALTRFPDIRGHWTDIAAIWEQALDAARELGDRRMEGNTLGNLGVAYAYLGEMLRAIGFFKQALAIADEVGNWDEMETTLDNMSVTLLYLGKAQQIIEPLKQRLAITRQVGDRWSEGATLDNLGLAYAALGNARRAIGYHERALEIAREVGDRCREGNAVGNLGLAYAALGQVEKAIWFHKQRLAIAREVGDRRGERNALGNLGNAYANLGQEEQAIEYHQQALSISREISDRHGEGADLGNLGNTYVTLGEVQRGIEFFEQALAIWREIGTRREEGADLGNLGRAYADLGDVQKANGFFEQALTIAREVGDRHAEANALVSLGETHRRLGDARQAIRFFEQALAIQHEIGDRRGEGITLGNLGLAHRQLGQVELAMQRHQQALQIACDIGDRRNEGSQLSNLGLVYRDLGHITRVREYLSKALAIFEEIKSPFAEQVRQWLEDLD